MIYLPSLFFAAILIAQNIPDPFKSLRKVYPNEVLLITSALGLLLMGIGFTLGIRSENRKAKS